jgi:predicted nucleic acid-binding Zn ribbon protein
MSKRTYEDVAKYVEWQSQNKCRVLSAKTEQTFDDLEVEVRVWNVKTDNDGSWWVVEGDTVPMNLYPQDAYYFGTDEVYSFHMGIMQRMKATAYNPEDYVNAMTLDSEIAPQLFRKLKNVATLIDSAVEVEDFQAIGVQCREVLIELGNSIYFPEMAGESEQPQASNFKKKGELFIQFHLSGSDNSDYRSIIKKLTESTWDYSNKITHSQNATFYEASTCVSLCVSLVGVYENIRQKAFNPISQYKCNNCTSKKLEILDKNVNEDGIIITFYLQCEECGEITEIMLEDNRKIRFVKDIEL